MYRYFISFANQAPNGALAFGNLDVTLHQPIRSIEDVNHTLVHLIREQGFHNVTVLSFSTYHKDTPPASAPARRDQPSRRHHHGR
ncbi:hypothetical protein [Phytohabitans kaempferiae]|uniref:Uncharacterized protein n=1 Tax=Phytohabitans kaempferiae TaxID=1620943 RepID=A0ABV6M0J1_9ACTN